tara:strand:+ start:189 stop:347 length:159 start_codon:yes stop_codon:yes gene_type:complete
MRVDLTEIHFIKQACENQTIKVSDARVVVKLMDKLDKEFERLQKKESESAIA